MKRPTIKVMGRRQSPMVQVKTTPHDRGSFDAKADAERLFRFLWRYFPAATVWGVQDLLNRNDPR